jgi:hypothetical protein
VLLLQIVTAVVAVLSHKQLRLRAHTTTLGVLYNTLQECVCKRAAAPPLAPVVGMLMIVYVIMMLVVLRMLLPLLLRYVVLLKVRWRR